MRLLIDGDACPDRQKVIELALHYGVEVLLFIDFAHVIEDERIQIIMCEVGKDSVDQMILSYLRYFMYRGKELQKIILIIC